MVDYAGTTAAGIERLGAIGFADALADGLAASVARARTIAGSGRLA
jgi:pyrroline-5-carboxylate reductase